MPQQERPNEFITLCNDYIEVSRGGDEGEEESGVFDNRVDKSVIESDYSNSDHEEDSFCEAENYQHRG